MIVANLQLRSVRWRRRKEGVMKVGGLEETHVWKANRKGGKNEMKWKRQEEGKKEGEHAAWVEVGYILTAYK